MVIAWSPIRFISSALVLLYGTYLNALFSLIFGTHCPPTIPPQYIHNAFLDVINLQTPSLGLNFSSPILSAAVELFLVIPHAKCDSPNTLYSPHKILCLASLSCHQHELYFPIMYPNSISSGARPYRHSTHLAGSTINECTGRVQCGETCRGGNRVGRLGCTAKSKRGGNQGYNRTSGSSP